MVRRKDLVDIGDVDYNNRKDEIIICKSCGRERGGTRGDFFMLQLDEELRCYCGGELDLVRRVCHLEPVVSS